MSRWALVRGGTCVTVVEQATQPTVDLGGLWVAAGSAGPGWTWDGTQWSEAQPPALPRVITRRAMRARFTFAERAAIEFAAVDDPGASQQQREAAAAIRAYLNDLAVSTYVDLDNAETLAGLQFLEAAGLISSGRADEIAEAEVQPGERP